MRVTHRMMVNDSIANMEAGLERLSELNAKFSSGKKIRTPSDDPAIAIAALTARSSLRNADSYINLAASAGNWLDANDVSLGQVITEVTRAMVLAQTGVGDTVGVDERATLAQEMDSMLTELIEIANTKHEGEYLYAGYLTQTRPFVFHAGTPDTVSHEGDTNVIERAVSPGQVVRVSIDGDATFTPVFEAIIRARDGLATNNTAEVAASISDIQDAIENVQDVRTANGSRRRQVNNTITRLEETKLDMQKLLSLKEDVNMSEIISDLQYQEVVYQSVLESGNIALSLPNMFSFLR